MRAMHIYNTYIYIYGTLISVCVNCSVVIIGTDNGIIYTNGYIFEI